MQDLATQFTAWVRTKPEDEAYDYCLCKGCAFYQFLSASGFPVKSVGVGRWTDADGNRHFMPPRVQSALRPSGAEFSDTRSGLGVSTFGALAKRLANANA